jgi:hypothetical protein
VSWYNPFSWFGTDTDKAIVDQAGHDTLLLAQARADAGAGIITQADYQALRETFLSVHGPAVLDAFDAAAPAVPAGATIAEIKDYINVSDIDMTAFQEPARAAAQAKVDAVYDNAVKKTISNPLSIIPAWLKWLAIAATALFALHTLARLGVRVPAAARWRRHKKSV